MANEVLAELAGALEGTGSHVEFAGKRNGKWWCVIVPSTPASRPRAWTVRASSDTLAKAVDVAIEQLGLLMLAHDPGER